MITVPKFQFKTVKDKSNLSSICNATTTFKNYLGHLDIIEVYQLSGFYGALIDPKIKVDFNYDYMLGKVKTEYKDSFNRIVTVKKLDNETP